MDKRPRFATVRAQNCTEMMRGYAFAVAAPNQRQSNTPPVQPARRLWVLVFDFAEKRAFGSEGVYLRSLRSAFTHSILVVGAYPASLLDMP
eukprot:3774889-Rhodomonas_salina.1